MFLMNGIFRFHLYTGVADMRKSFDGLCGIVSGELNRDPCDGDVYVFINRRRNQMKLLFWESGGFWLMCKRLEAGTFERLRSDESNGCLNISYETLVMLLEGIELSHVKRRRRHELKKQVA